jgi:ribosomal protein L23
MPTLYNVIRRPLITEKGLSVKETEGRWFLMSLPTLRRPR